MDRRSLLAGGAGVVVGATAAVLYQKNQGVKKSTSSEVAAPAIVKSSVPMTIVSTWPRDFPGLGISAQRFAQRVDDLSEGRIKTEYFAAGERVGAFDSFDEVASGNSQAYIGAEYYWRGKHQAFAYFTAVPFGMVADEINAWIHHGGGQELWDEVSGQFGVKGLLCGNTGNQMGGWFRKEMNSPDDFKGLKMRIPGLGGDVLQKLGASTVTLPGGQIYENLISGAIDATEWVGPYNDYSMKFYEAAQYYYTPGMHEPGAALALGMNASWWSQRTDWEKAVITAACREENSAQREETLANNGKYLSKMLNENGVKLRFFNDDIYDAFGEAAREVFAEVRSHSDLTAKVHDAFTASMNEIGSYYGKAEVEYLKQRNRVFNI